MPMHQLQRSWVRSQHPSAQWNLRGGRWSSVENSTKKIKNLPQKIKKHPPPKKNNNKKISSILLELREGEKEREKERERERNLWKVDTRKELQKEKEILELEVIL
jgi:hypothetical protein